MDAEVGLRELKKQMTREAIANAALKLTVERGIGTVTVEEIAREAFVSPRTFSNYFPSKEDAVLAAGTAGVMEVLDQFSADNGEEPPLQLLCRLVSDYAGAHPDHLRHMAQLIELEADNPSLKPVRAARQAEFEDLLRERVASRVGIDDETDLYPALVASAAVSAIMTALILWTRSDLPETRLRDMLEDAFNIVTAGYPHRHATDARTAPV
ncbi:TetR/AcrR family transcriptional regulator [Georgenia sp. H159]|uniref:TetR/AcrR family transcriptional regulator n=1 Tax=Georgenia sp. H159 TaxID=3076115 RepID=UPI002D78A681|nr:TetR family transcriptional regulator [Georgenia sp. H159]